MTPLLLVAPLQPLLLSHRSLEGKVRVGASCLIITFAHAHYKCVLFTNLIKLSMAAGCMIGSCVYIFGGLQQEGSQLLVYNDLWEFDLVTKRW